jgi:hypothetical protein
MADLPRLSPQLEAMLRQADAWESEAKRRRQITAIDAASDTLVHCAAQLRARVETEARKVRRVSVAEYCEILKRETGRKVTPQTVRAWIRSGALDAEKLGRDYTILREARPRVALALAS